MLTLLLALCAVSHAAPSADLVTSLPGWDRPLKSDMYSGYGYVEVGRGCRVFFDARGQQTSHQGHCSARQAWIAAETWGARRHAFRW